ncbi:hypothetical protein AAVH_18448 [Aphelenchoides avenae]|nr:hypothetical protein AAVH_18448 [Aphelenchus avenae]
MQSQCNGLKQPSRSRLKWVGVLCFKTHTHYFVYSDEFEREALLNLTETTRTLNTGDWLEFTLRHDAEPWAPSRVEFLYVEDFEKIAPRCPTCPLHDGVLVECKILLSSYDAELRIFHSWFQPNFRDDHNLTIAEGTRGVRDDVLRYIFDEDSPYEPTRALGYWSLESVH